MLDFLEKTEIIDDASYGVTMKSTVEPYLEKRRTDGYFISFDGKRMHYEAYEKLLSRGSVVILHGFCESAEKFREITYYFRKAGYSVFVPDLRGHGKSYHGSDKKETVGIDSFNTYERDLEEFIEKAVKPASGNRKIYIYSHSLGSTVSLLYLMKNPDAVSKAVLSSPMICPNTGMPVFLAGTASRLLCAAGGKNVSAPGRCVFNENASAGDSDAASPERFYYYHEKRIKEPLYQTSGPAFSWVTASLEARDKILGEWNKSRVNTKLLVFIPEEDKQLLTEYTRKFVSLSGAKAKKAENSRHEIFMSRKDSLRWYMEEIFDFFGD